jgi:hypothetical protein
MTTLDKVFYHWENMNRKDFDEYMLNNKQTLIRENNEENELTDEEIEDGAYEHFSHHSREYEHFIKTCKWYREQIKLKK